MRGKVRLNMVPSDTHDLGYEEGYIDASNFILAWLGNQMSKWKGTQMGSDTLIAHLIVELEERLQEE